MNYNYVTTGYGYDKNGFYRDIAGPDGVIRYYGFGTLENERRLLDGTDDESPHLDATPRFPAETVGSLLEEEE